MAKSTSLWLLVGLGNPGAEYAKTRHNIGFMVLDELAKHLEGLQWQSGFAGVYAKATIQDKPVILLKPQTFMNHSGYSTQPAAAFFKIPPEKMIVIHDELDLPFGEVRLKQHGGHGGHNGLKDIIRAQGPAFVRLRMGIGRPKIKGQEAEYVLKNYPTSARSDLEAQINTALYALETVVGESLLSAQQKLHTRPTTAIAGVAP